MSSKIWAKVVFCVVLFQCLSLISLAQTSGFGTISGTVQDPSGAVIPGVSMVLSNPGTVGGNQMAITDERGSYQFGQLVPGTYSVKAELPGFRSVARENVVVNANVTARVDLKLEVGNVTDTIDVTGDPVLLDTSTALHQTVLDNTVISTLPSRNDLWNLAKTVPGVILNKVDVGGTEAYSQSNATVHGAAQTAEGAFTIDGFEFGSALNAGASLAMYVATSTFQEINYQTGNASAESQRGGLVYNMVTRTGSNQFHGELQFSGSRGGLQSENITEALRNDFLAALPAKALAANPDFTPTGKIQGMYDSSFVISGPIVRDRLWFTGTIARGELNQFKVGSYNANGTRAMDRNKKKDASIKISLQLTPGQQLHFFHEENQKLAFNFRSGTFAEEAATQRQWPNKKHFDTIKWTAALSSKLVAEAGASLFWGSNTYQPQEGVGPGTIPRFDSVTQVNSGAVADYAIEPNRRSMALGNLSYNLGTHSLKFGYQFMGTFYYNRPYSLSHFPSGLVAITRNGVADSVNTYNTPVQYPSIERNHSFYVQDKWNLTRRLTFSWGLRLQKTYGWEPPVCQPTTPFITGKCFDKVTPPDFLTLNPRVAFIYDVFGNGRTAVKLTANRYDVGLGNPYVERISPVQLTSDTRTWTDNGDLIPQLNELGPSSGFALGSTNRYDPKLTRPYAIELSGEVEHQLPREIKVSVGYYHRENRKNIGSRNLLIPRESYVPLQVTEATSGKAVTVYNQAPALRGLFDVLWENQDQLNSQFNGVDVNVTKRFSSRWSILGGLSAGRNKGDVFTPSATTDINNPNFQHRRGVLATDVPFQAKAMGTYTLPFKIQLSGSTQFNKGFPERQTVSVGRNTVNLTQTTQVLDIAPRGVTRLPSITMVDLSIRREFNLTENTTVKPIIDILNVANINTTTARITQLGPTFGRVGGMVRGRLIRLGLNVNF